MKTLHFVLRALLLFTISCSNKNTTPTPVPNTIPKRPAPSALFNQIDIEGIRTTSNMQGIAVNGDYLFSLRNTGICAVIDLNSKSLVAEFPLGSFGSANHANVAFFGKEKFDSKDDFPLLYVSQANNTPVSGLEDRGLGSLSRLCFVERILTDNMGKPCGSELVQVFSFEPRITNSRLWIGDSKDSEWVYCYGNTVGNESAGNRIIIYKFRFPKFSKNNFIVRLTDNDVIETLYADEAFPEGMRGPQNNILQGAFVYDGVMFFPTGTGTTEHPSEIFYIDLKNRDGFGRLMRYGYHFYTDYIPCEMEDLDLWNGKLICATNSAGDVNPVYAFEFSEFETINK